MQPWETPNSIWKDEKAYLQWLRSSVRRIWSSHPVKIAYKQSRRYKAPVGRGGKEVWVSTCEMCGEQSRTTQIDHLHGGFGFTDWESFTDWAKMQLWVSFDDIRELCEDCHGAVTLSQKNKISLKEAFALKRVISLEKSASLVPFLLENGYTSSSIGKNAKQRRQQAIEILMNQEEDNV